MESNWRMNTWIAGATTADLVDENEVIYPLLFAQLRDRPLLYVTNIRYTTFPFILPYVYVPGSGISVQWFIEHVPRPDLPFPWGYDVFPDSPP